MQKHAFVSTIIGKDQLSRFWFEEGRRRWHYFYSGKWVRWTIRAAYFDDEVRDIRRFTLNATKKKRFSGVFLKSNSSESIDDGWSYLLLDYDSFETTLWRGSLQSFAFSI